MISCCIFGSKEPLMPLQVVQANATTPKPKSSNSGNNSASSRYILTVLDPGASDDFTHGLRVNPNLFALRAIRPAAIILRGLLVLVQLVIAAIITAPSGILPSSGFSMCFATPRSDSSDAGSSECGFEGPARLRLTFDKSNLSTRPYSADFKLSAHNPVSLAKCSTNSTWSSSRPVSFR